MDNVQAKDVLNVQYSVFLGVILSLSFCSDTSGTTPLIRTVIHQGRLEALLLIVYFLLDWFTHNVIEQKKIVYPVHLFVRIVWLAVLGVTVISMNSSGLWKFILITVYFGVSAVYDVFLIHSTFKNSDSADALFGYLLAWGRCFAVTLFLVPTLMAIFLRADILLEWDNPTSCFDPIWWCVLCYICLKSGRFAYLIRLRVQG